ncbi:MAG TPA: hypothetical protein VM095_13600 [Pyrinomonadaceae bacterium]|nr:hypothetical protein [Pyrinomonadaceae bacterium]
MVTRQSTRQQNAGAFGDGAADDATIAASSGGQSAGGGTATATARSVEGGDAGNDTASQVAAQLAEVLRGNPNALKDILAQAGQSTGHLAGQAAGQVQEQATSRLDKGKASVVEGLGSVVEQIRQMGENLRKTDQGGVVDYAAQYGDAAADRLERFSGYLNKHDVGEIVGDVEDFARRNAAYFVGGTFLLGLLGARFLKSSSPHQQLMQRLPPEGTAGSNTHTVYSRSEGSTEATATTSDGATHPLATPAGELP